MELKQINDWSWEIPKKGNMNVPGKIFASKALLDKIKEDKTIEQIRNVACLPGIIKHSLAMPDAHQGYGFSIGGVAAFDMDDGIISPGGVGYDINCSVRLIRTDFTEQDILKSRTKLINELFNLVPAGVGRKSNLGFGKDDVPEAVEGGAKWAVKQGYGEKNDYLNTEEEGCMKADFSNISDRAAKRGSSQLGTLGSGNHFLEIQKVEDILDEKTANIFGLEKGKAVVMVHCGSRGLGHQVASDYIKNMEEKYGFKNLPDRELINAPINSDLGKDYYSAMSGAANFGFANKQIITDLIRKGFEKVMGSSDSLKVVYDVCHNIAKYEKHHLDGEKRNVCVHRKGATRSFGPGREEIPDMYQKTGQPVLIPGSMGTASYVLVGTKKAEELSFGSTAHGAGRLLSRAAALRQYKGEKVVEDLKKKGIEVKGQSFRGIAEETYQAYKDVDEVVKTSNNLGIGNIVAKLKPLGVIKG